MSEGIAEREGSGTAIQLMVTVIGRGMELERIGTIGKGMELECN